MHYFVIILSLYSFIEKTEEYAEEINEEDVALIDLFCDNCEELDLVHARFLLIHVEEMCHFIEWCRENSEYASVECLVEKYNQVNRVHF